MKSLLKSTLILAVAAIIGHDALAQAPAQPAQAPSSTQQVRPAPGRRSPHDTISAVIGDRRTGNRVTIVYGRPFKKDPRSGEERKIWGTLVPYGKVWRTGADEATLFITQRPIMFGQVAIPAGAYSLFTLPAEDGTAKLIFNRQIGHWGTQYDEKQDFARVDLKKEALEKPADQFTMAIENSPDGGGIVKLMWENTQYSAAFTVPQ
ncbi:MAG: DUF2911 domain-containing protein [Acidobacteria bacterium]|nr:MAG: DUF2911 domain-containing protein [Acidobacteriota bacterium]